MKDALLIHLDLDGAAGWCLATDHLGNGIGSPRHRALAELGPAEAGGRRVVVLCPAEHCTILDVRPPVVDRAQLLRALPALVEDRLASDVERLHLSAGPIGVDGAVRVVAIERGVLDRILTDTRAAGLEPHHLVVDACCLPESVATTLVVYADRVLLRTPLRVAALRPDAAVLLLQTEALPEPVTLLAVADATALVERLRAVLDQRSLRFDERPIAIHEFERSLLRGALAALPFDLRHGPYRHHGADQARWRSWRLPLLLAACWLAFAFTQSAIEVGSLLRERALLDAQLRTLLTAVAPEAIDQPDPRPYLENRLRGTGAATGGASLDDVVRAAGALRDIGGAELTVIDARGGALELGVRAADLAALDAARGAVSRAIGRSVELRGATSDAGHAEARLVLAPGGGP